MRKFLTFDGDVLEETEWALKPTDRCFYCGTHFVGIGMFVDGNVCYESLDGNHDWITLVNPQTRR